MTDLARSGLPGWRRAGLALQQGRQRQAKTAQRPDSQEITATHAVATAAKHDRE